MHAFLVSGGTKQKRLAEIDAKQKTWRVSSFDRISLAPTEGTIGIAAVRDFQKQLMSAPYASPVKLGVITEAQLLTPEAQNALLKTLEEPPGRTIIMLETHNADLLAPTIVSRCTILHLAQSDGSETSSSHQTQLFETMEKTLQQPVGKRLAYVDTISLTREDAKAWTEEAIRTARAAMVKGNNNALRVSLLLRALLAARSQLAANVTPKLVLDNVFLSL